MKASSLAVPAIGVLLLFLFGAGRRPARARRREEQNSDINPPIVGESDRKVIVNLARSYLDTWRGASEPMKEVIIRDLWENSIGTPETYDEDLPWSGAFVSAVMNQAVPGALLPTGKHTRYARASLLDDYGRFRARRASDVTDPRPGDIVLKGRPGELRTFDELYHNEFPAHGDIITEVQPDSVTTIGGNKLGANILEEIYERDVSGAIRAPVFAVLQLEEE